MKKVSKTLALLLALAMCIGVMSPAFAIGEDQNQGGAHDHVELEPTVVAFIDTDNDRSPDQGEQTYTSLYSAIQAIVAGQATGPINMVANIHSDEEWTSELTVTSDFTIIGNGASVKVTNARTNNYSHMLFLRGSVSISDLTIDNSINPTIHGFTVHNGTIQNLTFIGGLTGLTCSKPADETHLTISGCHIYDQVSNAVYYGDDVSESKDLVVENCTLGPVKSGWAVINLNNNEKFTGNIIDGWIEGFSGGNGAVLHGNSIGKIKMCGNHVFQSVNLNGNYWSEERPTDLVGAVCASYYTSCSGEAGSLNLGGLAYTSDVVAVIDDQPYTSLKEAVDDAQSGDTIKLLVSEYNVKNEGVGLTPYEFKLGVTYEGLVDEEGKAATTFISAFENSEHYSAGSGAVLKNIKFDVQSLGSNRDVIAAYGAFTMENCEVTMAQSIEGAYGYVFDLGGGNVSDITIKKSVFTDNSGIPVWLVGFNYSGRYGTGCDGEFVFTDNVVTGAWNYGVIDMLAGKYDVSRNKITVAGDPNTVIGIAVTSNIQEEAAYNSKIEDNEVSAPAGWAFLRYIPIGNGTAEAPSPLSLPGNIVPAISGNTVTGTTVPYSVCIHRTHDNYAKITSLAEPFHGSAFSTTSQRKDGFDPYDASQDNILPADYVCYGLSGGNYVANKNHSWGGWSSNGSQHLRTCDICQTLDQGGHIEATDAAVDATCTAPGKTEGKHCSVCSEVLVAQTETNALGHSYSGPTCTRCGASNPNYVAPSYPAYYPTAPSNPAPAPSNPSTPSDPGHTEITEPDVPLAGLPTGDDVKSETVENADGSTTTKVETADGSKAEVIKQEDGSLTSTATMADGTTAKVEQTAAGVMTAEIKVSEAAAASGEAVAVVIPEVPVAQTSAEASTVKVEVPASVTAQAPVKVELPIAAADAKPGTVAILVKEDGTEEIVKTSYAADGSLVVPVTGTATVKIVDNSVDFADTRDHWSKDAVDFVSARELFNGTQTATDTQEAMFSPNTNMTRGMLFTVLARLDGQDTSKGSTWYDAGLTWAVDNGLTDGTAPSTNVSREQLATILYRYAGSPAVSGDLSAHPDSGNVSDWAKDAMAWAVEQGIISGTDTAGTLAPGSSAMRAVVSTMLMRFVAKNAK